MTIGIRLKEWRKLNHLKTVEISQNTGISTGALSNYENDKREISCNFLLKLKEIYDADIYYILTGVKNETLSKDEKEIIKCYRTLSEYEKGKLYGYMERIKEDDNLQEKKLSQSKIG